MAEGGKKDAAYISDIFDDKVMEYGPKMALTDICFFGGASNVQKAGQILMAKFPRTCCYHYHGGNMLSLSCLQILPKLSQSGYVIFYWSFLALSFPSSSPVVYLAVAVTSLLR